MLADAVTMPEAILGSVIAICLAVVLVVFIYMGMRD